jgi:glycosyltransferase involved in cell wall biosynthesis
MDCSIVIATKDRERYLERALASLEGQIGAPSFEVVVVDNGSSDGTAAVARRYGERLQLRYVNEPEPNRGRARNRGVASATGEYLLFCDDDVQAPPGWVAAHAAAHRDGDLVVNGPILNVPSYEARPKPAAANYSGAFLCTCNASLRKRSFERAGGFDEGFDLYGWEDTELGVRLRNAGLRRLFAWDAYIWHIKPPAEQTLAVESAKALARARMARRFVGKHPSRRARLATGAYALNLVRGRYLVPDPLLAICAGVATAERAPAWLRAFARAQFLDALYTRELSRAFGEADGR